MFFSQVEPVMGATAPSARKGRQLGATAPVRSRGRKSSSTHLPAPAAEQGGMSAGLGGLVNLGQFFLGDTLYNYPLSEVSHAHAHVGS